MVWLFLAMGIYGARIWIFGIVYVVCATSRIAVNYPRRLDAGIPYDLEGILFTSGLFFLVSITYFGIGRLVRFFFKKLIAYLDRNLPDQQKE